jgi:hypothetical protein
LYIIIGSLVLLVVPLERVINGRVVKQLHLFEFLSPEQGKILDRLATLTWMEVVLVPFSYLLTTACLSNALECHAYVSAHFLLLASMQFSNMILTLTRLWLILGTLSKLQSLVSDLQKRSLIDKLVDQLRPFIFAALAQLPAICGQFVLGATPLVRFATYFIPAFFSFMGLVWLPITWKKASKLLTWASQGSDAFESSSRLAAGASTSGGIGGGGIKFRDPLQGSSLPASSYNVVVHMGASNRLSTVEQSYEDAT